MSDHNIPQVSAGLDQNQTDLILEVTRRFTSTLELDQVLSQVLSLTVDVVDAGRGSIFVLNRSGQVTHNILARWYLPHHESKEIVSLVLDQGVAGHVFRHRKPILIADTETDERWIHLSDDPNITRSVLSVPLLYRDQLNGILTLTHAEPHHFDRDDLTLAINIAGQAAVAIENAQLFDGVRHSRETLHAVVSSVAEGILITNTIGQILYANPASAAALGVSAVAVRGEALADVAPDPRLPELLQSLLESSEPQRGEIYSSDGRTFDASLVLVPSAGVVVTLHDVTRLKEMDALKSELVANVSHDLKSPLGLIYGYAWLLADLASLPTEAHSYVEMIINGIQTMQETITSLLDLTMIESGIDQVQEIVDLVELIDESLAAFDVQIREKELQVSVDTDPEQVRILGHPPRLGQAINNLISNAVKYTPPGGQICVAAERDADQVHVRVSDNGPGIPIEKQEGLFNKFYKVGGRETIGKEGHGLGLAIVKSVVEAHNGQVKVQSDEGQGATFTLTLPLTAPALAPNIPTEPTGS